jgi:hypothetical protein
VRIRNSFWFAHQRLGSRARVFHGCAYALPDDFGPFDITVLSSVLLHTKLPLEVISQCAKLTRETMIVTERHFPELGGEPVMRFDPEPGQGAVDTWWRFTPAIVTRMLGVYGFTAAQTGFHRQAYYAGGTRYDMDLFTTLATVPAAAIPGPLAFA